MIAFVLLVIADSTKSSLRFIVSGRQSINTGTPFLINTEVAVEVKVNEGIITSSPGLRSIINIAISNAEVQEGVKNAAKQFM
jgi:hypothetical protein